MAHNKRLKAGYAAIDRAKLLRRWTTRSAS